MIQKSLQCYLSKFRKAAPNSQCRLISTSSKKWISKGFKPFADNGDVHHQGNGGDGNNNDESATLYDIDRFLFENFNSLYVNDDQEIKEEEEDDGDREVKSPGVIFFESPRLMDPPPNLSGSDRFFVVTGFSSSLIEEARHSSVTNNNSTSISEGGRFSSTSANNVSTSSTSVNESNSYSGSCGGGGDNVKSESIHSEYTALLTCSVNPYGDFRRSMQEMVDARLNHGSKIDWDFVEELLFCYLNLNDQMAYKFILCAFVDMVVDLRRNDGKIPARASRNSKFDVRYKRSRRTRHSNVT